MTKRTLRTVPTQLTAEVLRNVAGGEETSVKFSPWIVRNKKGDGSTVDSPLKAP